jgi:hypothetical protein
VLLSLWGLVLFVGFQWFTFGEPFAFVKGQSAWHIRPAPRHIWSWLWSLVSVEPIRATYSPASPCYWRRWGPWDDAFLNLYWLNPIWFVATTVLIALGAWRRWLTIYEIALSIGLLAIPYLTQTGRQGMISEARFASVVFPSYIVMGECLARMPKPMVVFILVVGAAWMFVYTGMFVCGFGLI